MCELYPLYKRENSFVSASDMPTLCNADPSMTSCKTLFPYLAPHAKTWTPYFKITAPALAHPRLEQLDNSRYSTLGKWLSKYSHRF